MQSKKLPTKLKNVIYQNPYKTKYFDTHCHLDRILPKCGYNINQFPQFINENCLGNFGGCVAISCSTKSINIVSEFAKYDKVYPSFGLHPHYANDWTPPFRKQIIESLTSQLQRILPVLFNKSICNTMNHITITKNLTCVI